MDHRLGKRSLVSLDVIIRDRNGLTQSGRVQNINGDGMYIQTALHDLKKGMVIDIELASGCSLRAWVAHTEDKGLGVMFVSSSGCKTGELNHPMFRKCLKYLEDLEAILKQKLL